MSDFDPAGKYRATSVAAGGVKSSTADFHRSAAAAGAAASANAKFSTASESKPQSASVEWDHKGRVIRSRFNNGYDSQFRYDQQGSLYAFTYARLAWSTTDGARWTAVDQDNNYVLDGTVEICVDGTLRIERLDISRRIRLNGTITDQKSDGTTLESNMPAEMSPADLLATIKPKYSEVTRYASAVEAAAAGEPSPVPPVDSHPRLSAQLPVSDMPSPNASQRKLIAQGMRINRMRSMQTVDPDKAPKATSTMRSSILHWWTNVQIRVLQALHGADHPSTAPCIDVLAFLAHDEQRIDEARMLHERSLQIRRKGLGPQHADVGISMYGLGRIYHEWGRFSEAEQYYLQAIKLFEYGFKKSRFLFEQKAADTQYLFHNLTRLTDALHSLATLYFEQKQFPLCGQLQLAANKACQSLSVPCPSSIINTVGSISKMAAVQQDKPVHKPVLDSQLRTSRWERTSGV